VPASILGEGSVEDVEVIENHTAYFACPAEGIPPPSILWLRNKTPLLDFPYPNLRELSNGRQLELRNVQVSDEGIFECQATNVAGQKSKSFKLKVQGLWCLCD
jgi:Immunoglobulin I-set domain